MKRVLFFLVICFSFLTGSSFILSPDNQVATSIKDGPYIFSFKNRLKSVSVENGILVEKDVTPENFDSVKSKFNLNCTFQDLTINYLKNPDYSQSYKIKDRIGVISDIHGRYDTYLELLKAAGIIDDDLKWKFGRGHLVVLGDIFDKGDMVTEVLWHLFGLEKQASESGGMVHVLLGNHDIMALVENPLYINEKYRTVEEISGLKYFELFQRNSVLGNWLRSKPVVITINDIIFIHGGISTELVRKKLTFEEINRVFSKKIYGKELKEIDDRNEKKLSDKTTSTSLDIPTSIVNDFGRLPATGAKTESFTKDNELEELRFFVHENGPVWYRGYFIDSGFRESTLDSILDYYNKKHIIVGHTVSEDIVSLFNNKIIGVDAGISIGNPGAMLLHENGLFYKVYNTGVRVQF